MISKKDLVPFMAPHKAQEDKPSDFGHKDESGEVLMPSGKPITSQFLQDPVNFNPSFYDALGTVFLTKRALREVDRRSKLPGVSTWVIECPDLESLPRFGRQGGPDLSGLCGVSIIPIQGRRAKTAVVEWLPEVLTVLDCVYHVRPCSRIMTKHRRRLNVLCTSTNLRINVKINH